VSRKSRRHFLKKLGGLVSGTVLASSNIFAADKQPPLGLQLYTLRDEIKEDLERTIRKISEIGYSGVETYFLPEKISLKETAELLDKYGLEVFAMHSELPTDQKKKDKILKRAELYNSKRVVWHGWPETDRFANLDKMKKTVERYNKVNKFLQKNGLELGLHNHWWEFEKVEGRYPFYYLLENLDKDIFFEIDVYWTKTGGVDPVKALSDFGDRASLVHIKDGPATTGGKPIHEQVAVGQGNLDIEEICKAAQSHADWLIVELDDCKTDIFEAIEDSYNYLTNNNLAG